MKKLNISITIMPILPCILVIPVLIDFTNGIHIGGINLLIRFLQSAFFPSFEESVLVNAINSLSRTISIAFISWIVSITIGLILGILSSNLYSKLFELPLFLPSTLRRLFSIPRAIHELVWGLILQGIFGFGPLIAITAISIPYSFLFAKIVSDQIDTFDSKELIALNQMGSSPINTLITFLFPKLRNILINFGGYRLECALRGATLLGVFGLGGIGTELNLTLKSLQFNEMWTSLWLLFIVMYLLEKIINLISSESKNIDFKLSNLFVTIFLIIILLGLCINNILQDYWVIPKIANDLVSSMPNIKEFESAFNSLDFISLISKTLVLTLLSAAIATSIPPILMIICQHKRWYKLLSNIWILFRLIPPPVSALLLLMCSKPSLSIGAIALGIHNMGIMGRKLQEGINNLQLDAYCELISKGVNPKIAWLYGLMSKHSRSYLAYAAYRMDVILRETTIVGVVGGVGLGWQLQESLSSFAWAEVISIIMIYIVITILSESISNQLRTKWIEKPKLNFLN